MTDRLDPMGTVTRVTVHHSGEANNMQSEAQIAQQLEEYRVSQSRSAASGGLGAGDLAYHFVIDRRGVVWEGRPLCYQGAHAGNSLANRGNVGVCLLGNFNVQNPNSDQTRALRDLLNKLMARYRLAGSDVYTHREVKAQYGLATTDCPGTYLQQEVATLRYQLKAERH